MAFHTRPYIVHVILGSPVAEPLWKSAVWDTVVGNLDPLMSSPRGRTAVRSLQYSLREPVRFGRIGWNAKGHRKWTHQVPSEALDGRLFYSVEAWAPSWTVCERDSRPPDTFLYIGNEASINSNDLEFNPVVLLAAAKDCDALREHHIGAVEALVATMRAVLHVWKVRTWGVASGGGFTDALQDIVVTGLFRPGKRHDGVPTIDIFSEEWSEVAAG